MCNSRIDTRRSDESSIDIAARIWKMKRSIESSLSSLPFPALVASSGPPGSIKASKAHIDASSGTTWVVFSSRRLRATSQHVGRRS